MNLDGMNYDELVDFWKEAFYHPDRVGRRLLPRTTEGIYCGDQGACHLCLQ